MKTMVCIWVALLLPLAAQEMKKLSNREAEDKATAQLLRETVQQWIQAEALASEELADWEANQGNLRELLALYRAELGKLDELLVKAGSSAASSDAERSKISAEIADLRKARSTFISQIKKLQPRTLAIATRLPQPLRTRLRERLLQIESLEADQAPRELTEAMVAVIAGAAEFNAGINLETEVREFDGHSFEMRILYLGLSRAFFCSRDGKYAGIGTPRANGWQWQARPELAQQIQRAIDITSKQERPDFIELPLEIVR